MARDALRSHLSGSVPISIAVHLGVLLMLLIVPLAADIALPLPEKDLPEFIRVAPAPPPAPAFAPASRHPSTSVPTDPSVAPTAAPPRIEPETATPGPQFDVPIGPPGGVPAGVGDIASLAPPAPAPPDSPRPATVRVAQLPEPPRKIVDLRPVYPDIARKARVEGTVILESVLDTSGDVTQLRVIRSVPLLDQAALDAVRQWKYTPTVYGGRPVSVLMTITIRFTLNQ
ncbi:MAG TPA: TonB family protein [Vicinamibacterales bacterium]|jgi:protein TonB|nr:TonB family protein [Vicinamibacterales bacterium]